MQNEHGCPTEALSGEHWAKGKRGSHVGGGHALFLVPAWGAPLHFAYRPGWLVPELRRRPSRAPAVTVCPLRPVPLLSARGEGGGRDVALGEAATAGGADGSPLSSRWRCGVFITTLLTLEAKTRLDRVSWA